MTKRVIKYVLAGGYSNQKAMADLFWVAAAETEQ